MSGEIARQAASKKKSSVALTVATASNSAAAATIRLAGAVVLIPQKQGSQKRLRFS